MKCRFPRKIKEALLSMKIERAYTKDKILELYINEIYLGSSAPMELPPPPLSHFDKSVSELTIEEAGSSSSAPQGALTLCIRSASATARPS